MQKLCTFSPVSDPIAMDGLPEKENTSVRRKQLYLEEIQSGFRHFHLDSLMREGKAPKPPWPLVAEAPAAVAPASSTAQR